MSDFLKKRYKDVRINVISVTRGWVGGCRKSRKKALSNLNGSTSSDQVWIPRSLAQAYGPIGNALPLVVTNIYNPQNRIRPLASE